MVLKKKKIIIAVLIVYTLVYVCLCMFYERECSSHRGQQRAEVVRVVVPPPPQGWGLEVQVLSLCPGRALWALSSGVSSPNPCACFYRTHASYEQGYMYVTRVHVCNTRYTSKSCSLAFYCTRVF